MNPLESYLKELAEIRAADTGVKETSYYGPLANLLNEIGKTLKPKVHFVINKKQFDVVPVKGPFVPLANPGKPQ